MKTAMLYSGSEVEVIDQEPPLACNDYAVVKVHSAPMCTEYLSYKNGEEDLYLGHEAAGEVVEVAQPGKVKVGDRVVVMPQYPCGKCDLCLNGDYIHCEHVVDPLRECSISSGIATYSQYVIKQDWLLLPVPEGMSYDHASMANCGLGSSFGAMNLMEVGPFDTVLITGLGPVGMGAVINSRVRGAKVIAVARNDYRRQLAKELGASVVLHPGEDDAVRRIKELTGGKGADKSVDCSGGVNYQLICVRGTRRKGHVAFVGESGDLTVKVSQDLIRNGLTLHGSWHWNLRDRDKMMETIKRAPGSIDRLITHTFPLSEVEEAFKLQMSGRCGKVVLHPWE